MKHILYDKGVLPSPHKSLYNHLSFIDSVVWTVVRGGPAHGSPALHMLCFLTLNLRLSHTISKHHKTVKTEQWALLHPPPPTPSHFHPAFYTPAGLNFSCECLLVRCKFVLKVRLWVGGGGCDGKEQIKRQTLTCFSCICYRKTHSMSKLQVCFTPATSFLTHKPSNIWTVDSHHHRRKKTTWNTKHFDGIEYLSPSFSSPTSYQSHTKG